MIWYVTFGFVNTNESVGNVFQTVLLLLALRALVLISARSVEDTLNVLTLYGNICQICFVDLFAKYEMAKIRRKQNKQYVVKPEEKNIEVFRC